MNAGVKGESVSRETFLLGQESSGEKNTKQFVTISFDHSVTGLATSIMVARQVTDDQQFLESSVP
ncbi:MAG: hypothetical protein ABSD30_12030 [Candidatus Binatus sp.]